MAKVTKTIKETKKIMNPQGITGDDIALVALAVSAAIIMLGVMM